MPSSDPCHSLTMEQQIKAPPEIKKVAQFLRGGGAGIKVRVGALNGKRLDYFKGACSNEYLPSHTSTNNTGHTRPAGKSAIKALLSPAFAKQKGVPKVTSETEAQNLLAQVNAFAYFLRVQRGAPSGSSSSSPKHLQVIPEQMFGPQEYYAWFYEGSQWTTYAGGVLMVVIMLAGVMFPLWPPIMRLGVWYLSIAMLGFIGLFFAIAVVRLIFYIISIVVASPGIWIFPQLFADVGFVRIFCCFQFTWDGFDGDFVRNIRLNRLSPCGSGICPRKSQRRGRARRRTRGSPRRRRFKTMAALLLKKSMIRLTPVHTAEVLGSRKWRTMMHRILLFVPDDCRFEHSRVSSGFHTNYCPL